MIQGRIQLTLRVALACLLVWTGVSTASAQFAIRGGVVGGVSVDADGVVRDLSAEDHTGLLEQLRATVKSPTGALSDPTSLRMISLSKLQEAIAQAIVDQQPLPDEILYLAGLQRIEYVLAYPDEHDIVLAGPAEPWVVRKDASVVGKKSGRPVLQLEDLLVALRTSDATRHDVISVSIDPTPEGERRLRELLTQYRTSGQFFDPTSAEPAMKNAFGQQQVTLTTVPKSSRMANVLVAADYEMKRIAMHLVPSPVKGLPSFMEMIRERGLDQRKQPRWWMATDYDAILHSDDRLAWKITGLGIKTLTEDSFVNSTGVRTQTGKANPVAQRWADVFTSKFDQLCAVNPVFGDLRNVIDMNIVAAIIRSQQLQETTGCDLSLLCGPDSSQLATPEWRVPEHLDPHCSFVKSRVGWTVSASGGVEINPWQVVGQASKLDDSIKSVHQEARSVSTKPTSTWWWN